MKKILCILLLCTFMLCLALPLEAECFPDYIHRDYASYERYVSEQEMPAGFVHYHELRFLGEFVEFRRGSLDQSGLWVKWKYTLQDDARTVYVMYVEDVDVFQISTKMKEVPPEAVKDTKNMRTLRSPDYTEGENWQYVDLEDVQYYYNEVGNLRFVLCKDKKSAEGYYVFMANDLYCYPRHRRDFLSRLLNYSTAEEAMMEFEARIAGDYREPWQTVAVIAGGVALVAIPGAAVAVMVRRRRARRPLERV